MSTNRRVFRYILQAAIATSIVVLLYSPARCQAAEGVELGPWYCIGPFKDRANGLHREEFEVLFPPEQTVIDAGRNLTDLSATYRAKPYPGIEETQRSWARQDKWVDGYVNSLPTGPPPMKNETCYLYRTIRSVEAQALSMRVDALDNVRAWLNGKPIGVAHNPHGSSASRFPASLGATLNLEQGDNRLLIKITSMHGAHGFAFSLPPHTPSNSFIPGQGTRSVPSDLGRPFYISSDADKSETATQMHSRCKNLANPPQYYQRRDTWQQTWIATRREVVERAGFGPSSPEASSARGKLWNFTQADFTSDSFRQHLRWISRDLTWRDFWETGDVTRCHRYHIEGIKKLGILTAEEIAALPQPADEAAMMQIIGIYNQVNLRTQQPQDRPEMRFSVEPIPMFDPPRLAIAQTLEQKPGSESGGAYLQRLARLQMQIETTTDNNPGESTAEKLVDDFWQQEMKQLPPIAMIRCPAFSINAIAPYTSRGAAPADICIFDPTRPDEPPRVIFHEPQTTIYDMNLSYDGRTIFFSARIGGGPWHIYEIGTDGENLRQITTGSSSNISPLLLPSGEIMFVSTRAGNHVVCQQGPAGSLYVCDRDGSNVRRVSGNTLSDHTPQIMNDGRVSFTRWDYGVDKNVFCRQKIWTMNPDGTGFQLFYGNTIEDPNGFWQARAIPGRSELLCVLGPHHNHQAGMIGLVSSELGIEAPRGEGFRFVTTELPAVGDISLPWGFRNPFALDEHRFLVTWGGDGGNKNRIYLLDDHGNRKCIYEADGNLGCWNPLPIEPRKTPPIIPSRCQNIAVVERDPIEAEQNPDDSIHGTLMLQNVYDGIGDNVATGEIAAIQIVEQVPRGRPTHGSAIYGHWTVVSRGTMYVRRLIGTVPVESDGSAHFTAPAIRDISFNAVDAQGRVVRYMGSTTQVMPGERVACVGCHENRDATPSPLASVVSLAARRAPSVPKYPEWTQKGILDFRRVVQPVLDRHCTECHSGATPAGAVDLTDDKTHLFNMAYDTLLDRGLVHYRPTAGVGHGEDTAKARGSHVSRIRELIERPHANRGPIPLEDRKRIYAWIDANVPYYGTTSFRDGGAMGARDRWDIMNAEGWFQKDFVPVFNRRCLECHQRHVRPQTYNYNPSGDGRIMVTSKLWTPIALSQFQLGHGRISGVG